MGQGRGQDGPGLAGVSGRPQGGRGCRGRLALAARSLLLAGSLFSCRMSVVSSKVNQSF